MQLFDVRIKILDTLISAPAVPRIQPKRENQGQSRDRNSQHDHPVFRNERKVLHAHTPPKNEPFIHWEALTER